MGRVLSERAIRKNGRESTVEGDAGVFRRAARGRKPDGKVVGRTCLFVAVVRQSGKQHELGTFTKSFRLEVTVSSNTLSPWDHLISSKGFPLLAEVRSSNHLVLEN